MNVLFKGDTVWIHAKDFLIRGGKNRLNSSRTGRLMSN